MRLINADKLIDELNALKIVDKGSVYDEMRNFAVLTLKDAPTVIEVIFPEETNE